MSVEVCPVCMGRGFVQSGFYNSTSNTYITSTTGNETCRSCNGKGYVGYECVKSDSVWGDKE